MRSHHVLPSIGGGSSAPAVWSSVSAPTDGTTDATSSIQSALTNAAAGSTVVLPPGRYALTAPLVIPPGVTLRGVHGSRTDSLTASALVPTASFSGSAVIKLLDKEQGPYAVENEGVRIVNLTIDGTSAPASVAGVSASGRVHGTVLDRVAIQNTTGGALVMANYTRADSSVKHPFSWNIWNSIASNVTGDGWNLLSATDSTLDNVEAIGCSGNGFVLSAAANSQLNSCRSEWSGSSGYYITGNYLTGQGSGGIQLTGCTTDRSSGHGILVDSTGAGQVLVTSCTLRRDGRNGFPGTGGGSFAALRVSSSTMPVVATGLAVYPGLNDDGAGVNSPQYAVSVSGSTAVVVESGYLHAATTVWNDGGSNSLLYRGPGVVGATGTGGSPTRETATNLDVTGRALGMPQARDFGLVAQTYDSNSAVGPQVVTNGTVYLMALYLPRQVTLNSIVWFVASAAVTPTAGQNEVGLYSSAGTKLVSTNVDSATTSVNVKITSITPTTVGPGWIWVGMVFNAATPPSLARGGDLNAGLINANLAAANYRAATNGTGATVLPSSITPASNSAYQRVLWCGAK